MRKKWDKKGLEFRAAFFAIIIASFLIVAVGQLIGEWNEDYGSGISYDLGEFDKSEEAEATAASQKTKISVKSATSGEEFEGTSIRGVFGVLNTLHEAFDMVFGSNGMLNSLSNRFGIPRYIIITFIILSTFAITFRLVSILFRLPRGSA